MSLPRPPLTIRMHADDNVAIVANDGGLPAGTVLPEGVPGAGSRSSRRSRRATRWRSRPSPQDAVVRRYGVPIGYALKDLPAGSWVHERVLKMPAARALEGLPMATVKPPAAGPLDGLHLRGLSQRRRLGRHAQPPRHHHHRAMRGRRGGAGGRAHQGGTASATIRTWTTSSASSTATAAAWPSTRRMRSSPSARSGTSPSTRISAAR